jgi:hypothetical protein
MHTNFRKYNLLLLLTFVVILSSCEKVLDLNLDQTAPKIVIEGILTNLNTNHVVSVSHTKNFDEDNMRAVVSGAVISVTDENGQRIIFTEQGKTGNYYSSRFRGVPGRRYTMTVTTNGQTYTATSRMPFPVPIRSLTQVELSFFGETRKLVEVNYLDPANIENFYYTKLYVNNIKRGSLDISSDRFNDGKAVKNATFVSDPDLETGDKVKIQLLTVDESVFKYLFSLSQITGNGGPPTTPANPTSNFNNGAVGYFSASTLSTDSLVIK